LPRDRDRENVILITTIRPKVVFQKIEERLPSQNVGFKVNIPSTAIGGMTLLESSILVSLAKLFEPLDLFEFGTYLGATTLLLAENTSPEARIVTLDIPQDVGASQQTRALNVLEDANDNDAFLRQTFVKSGAVCVRRAPSEIRAKIKQLYQDSTTLNVASAGLERKFDYVFIDGGHDLATVAIDTNNALRMLKPSGVILWHDFESKIHGDVTTFLREYAKENALFHVEHTMLAFQLFGPLADEF
jgi:predicted O-methyltransferase YrrM